MTRQFFSLGILVALFSLSLFVNSVLAGPLEDAQAQEQIIQAQQARVATALQQARDLAASGDLDGARAALDAAEVALGLIRAAEAEIGNIQSSYIINNIDPDDVDLEPDPVLEGIAQILSDARAATAQAQNDITTGTNDYDAAVDADLQNTVDNNTQTSQTNTTTNPTEPDPDDNIDGDGGDTGDPDTPPDDRPDDFGEGSGGDDDGTDDGGGNTQTPVVNSSGNAGLVPCGSPGQEPCQLCHFVTLGFNVITWLRSILIITCILIITIAGVMYVVSAGDSGMTTMAKNAIKYALWGTVIILVAWVVITFIMSRLAGANGPLGIYADPNKAWTFVCG